MSIYIGDDGKKEEGGTEAPSPDPLDLSQFRKAPSAVSACHDRALPGAKKIDGAFVKGPIPVAWLSSASALGGKVLNVAMAIWFEAGRRKAGDITLTTKILDRFNVKRNAKYEAIKRLEQAGLIVLLNQDLGKNPRLRLAGGNRSTLPPSAHSPVRITTDRCSASPMPPSNGRPLLSPSSTPPPP